MTVTTKNLDKVLANIAAMAKGSKEDGKVLIEALNRMLDELLGDDFFGTEGQLDPRGDRRNDS
jgi:hypothetical protein